MMDNVQQNDVHVQSAGRWCTLVIRIAVEALPLMYRKGDATAVAALRTRMHDPVSGVRLSAVKSLSLIEKGARVVADLSAMLGDSVSCMRSAALESFAKLTARLNHPNLELRRWAEEALRQVQHVSDDRSINAVGPQLSDQDPAVRLAARLACCEVACRRSEHPVIFLGTWAIRAWNTCDEQIIAAVSTCCEYPDAEQRCRAKEILGGMTCEPVVSAVASCLDDPNVNVRHASTLHCSPKFSVSKFANRLVDEDVGIRVAAVRADAVRRVAQG